MIKSHSERLKIVSDKPLKNPDITSRVFQNLNKIKNLTLDNLVDINIDKERRILGTEARLLAQWKYGAEWKEHLDAPLIAHADAAIDLKKEYDCTIAATEKSFPYAEILKIMGMEMCPVDFISMEKDKNNPKVKEKIEKLREKRVLIVDREFITTGLLKKVYEELRNKGINANGAYLGISNWEQLNVETPYLNGKLARLHCFWEHIGSGLGLMRITNCDVYKKGLLPKELKLYSVNGKLYLDKPNANQAARRVAINLKKISII